MWKNNLYKKMRNTYGLDLSYELKNYKFLCGETKRKHEDIPCSFKEWDKKIKVKLKGKSKMELYEINRILEILLVKEELFSEFTKGAGTVLFSVMLSVGVSSIVLSDLSEHQIVVFLIGMILLVFLTVYTFIKSFKVFKTGSIDVKMYQDIIRLVKKIK